MGSLAIAQYMVAATFFSVALTHFLVWYRNTYYRVHLLFALTALAAGANSIAEAWFYSATTLDTFIPAFKWYVSFSGLWLIAFVWFVGVWTGISAIRRRWLIALSAVFCAALVINFLAPYGILFTEITYLRQIQLPWGDQIALPEGLSSPWRYGTDIAMIGVLALVVNGWMNLRRQGKQRSDWLLGGSLLLFFLLFFIHADLIDYGVLDSPYLSSYGFLAVVLVMSYELAGKIVVNERRWRSLLEQSHLLIAGVDRNGLVGYVNPFFEKVSGYNATEIKGQFFLRLLPENDRSLQEVSYHAALAGAIQPRKEAVLLTKSGTERVILWSSVLLKNGSCEIAGVLSVGVDVTEQRQAETSRDQAIVELQNALHEVKALKRRLQDEVVYLQEEIKSSHNFAEIIGQSDALAYVLHKIEQVAPLNTPVLIEGETGVGKELVARAIHHLSPRRNRPLVKINCAALPPNLIEAELFGYEKGAFTGAIKARRGRFELADGGTLFLDEIGELPLDLQPKLLRVLQDGELERIGSEASVKVDVRIVAATNRHLREAIKQNQFREDLFYRLYVHPITVPPLRQRKEDIPLLAKAFIDKCATVQGKRIETVQQSVMEQLLCYDWPGNVRELENVIKRAVIVTPGKTLRLAESLVNDGARETKDEVGPQPRKGYQGTLEEVERDYIVQILEHCYWRIEGERGAAWLLGINPSTLRSRMRKLGIKRLSRVRMVN